jgi:hypothetical protein
MVRQSHRVPVGIKHYFIDSTTNVAPVKKAYIYKKAQTYILYCYVLVNTSTKTYVILSIVVVINIYYYK